MHATLKCVAVAECEGLQAKALVRVLELQEGSASESWQQVVEGRFAAVPLAAEPSSREHETAAQCGNRPGE